MQIVQDAVDAEFPGVANCWMSSQGKVTFHGRHARFDPSSVAAGADPGAWDFTRWKVGDEAYCIEDGDAAQVRAFGFERSRKRIINAARALPFRGDQDSQLSAAQINAQIVADFASIERYGVRSWSADDLITFSHKTNGNNDLQETKLMAEYYVENYKDAQTRITQLVFRSVRPDDPRGPATWDLLTEVEISDIVRVTMGYPGGDGFSLEEFYVEGISYEVRPLNADYADVTLSLDVSPTAYYALDPFTGDE